MSFGHYRSDAFSHGEKMKEEWPKVPQVIKKCQKFKITLKLLYNLSTATFLIILLKTQFCQELSFTVNSVLLRTKYVCRNFSELRFAERTILTKSLEKWREK